MMRGRTGCVWAICAMGWLHWAAPSASATLIAYWNFGSTSGSPNLTVTQGAGTITIDPTWGSGDITSFAGTTLNALPGDTAGQALALLNNANNGKFIKFQVSSTGLTNIVLTFAAQRTATGFLNNDVAYSTDNVSFTSSGVIGTPYTPTPTGSFALQTIQLPTGADNKPNLYIRITMNGATGLSGNNRFDNVQFNGTPGQGTMGACCVGMQCSQTTQANCAGTWTASTPCTPNPCGATGACCVGTNCTPGVTQAQCSGAGGLGGVYKGDNSTCEPGICDPLGACCLSISGECVDDVTQAQCISMQGNNWSANISCSSHPACVTATQAPLIISEYYESAPGNRKAIELFNTSTNPISLNGHALRFRANTCTGTPPVFRLDDRSIPALGTLVFINNATDDIPNFDESQAVVAPSVINFNGDDAIELVFGDVLNGPTVIDAFAVPCQQDSGPRGNDPYADAAWERACSVTTGAPNFDPCNFDGKKNCSTGTCPPGTPVSGGCTDGSHANEWVFEGRNPSSDNGHHSLGVHNCLTNMGACCVGGGGGPGCACPGDMNNDQAVTLGDVSTFVDVLLGNATGACADANQDGSINGKDVAMMTQLILNHATCSSTSCSIMTLEDCQNAGGQYQGNGVLCSPSPCGPRGSCCTPSFSCTDNVTLAQCMAINPSATWTNGGTCAANCVLVTPPGLVVNEYWADDAGTDSAEYIELYCPSCGGVSLNGFSVIVMEGDTDPGGTASTNYKAVDNRWDLTGPMPVDGYLVIGGGTTPNIDISFSLGTTGLIENGAKTFAIVRTRDLAFDPNSSTNQLSNASVSAITANLIDAIAVADGGANDTSYFNAPVLPPHEFAANMFEAWHTASRIPNGVDTNTGLWNGSTGDWRAQSNFDKELFDANDQLSSPGTSNTIDPVGICCNGLSMCSMATVSNCQSPSMWGGRLSACGGTVNPCLPSGACCTGTSCEIRNNGDCSGTYKGDGTSCSPLPCGPTGSCCAAGFASCTEGQTAEQCAAAGGMWTQGGTCAANCVPPTGACCTNDVCSNSPPVTRTQCNDGGGYYLGDNSTCGAGCPVRPCLIISEVVDGNRAGGLPKYVEIKNTSATDYTFTGGGVIIQANASSDTMVDVDLTGVSIAAGQAYVVAAAANSSNPSGSQTFMDTYGFAADLYSNASFGNGDDRYMITDTANGSHILDTYGVFGVLAADNSPWNYEDGYAYRLSAASHGNLGQFIASEWSLGHRHELVGTDDASNKLLLQQRTTPKSHTSNSCTGGGGHPEDYILTICPGNPPQGVCPQGSFYCNVGVTGFEVPGAPPGSSCVGASNGLEVGQTICIQCSNGTCFAGHPFGSILNFKWENYDGAGHDCYFTAFYNIIEDCFQCLGGPSFTARTP